MTSRGGFGGALAIGLRVRGLHPGDLRVVPAIEQERVLPVRGAHVHLGRRRHDALKPPSPLEFQVQLGPLAEEDAADLERRKPVKRHDEPERLRLVDRRDHEPAFAVGDLRWRASLVDPAFPRRLASSFGKTPFQTVRAVFPHTAYQ
jgi:hypothetical protein